MTGEPEAGRRDRESTVLDELVAREPLFHRPELGTGRGDFAEMVTDDFWEVGASGRRYDREHVLDALEARHSQPHDDVYEAGEFDCRQVGPDVFLLRYVLAQGDRVTRRATLWELTSSGWRAIYHQGTPLSGDDRPGVAGRDQLGVVGRDGPNVAGGLEPTDEPPARVKRRGEDAGEGDDLREHLESRYAIAVEGVRRLDAGVFRVQRRDGTDWIARRFGPPRSPEDTEGDARILRALEKAGFPAERCADEDPVSVLGAETVLVTEFVDGARATGSRRTFAVLGALLGRLHARPATTMRPGGAWHHLAPRGGPQDEADAGMALLIELRGRITGDQVGLLDAVCEHVDGLDTCRGLPEAFIHLDFVPANAITTPDGRTVIVDWTNAGRGPRLWSLGFLLFAAGARDLRLVDAVVTRYRRHTELVPDEIGRLAGAIRARPLLIDCWSTAHGRKSLAAVASDAADVRELSEVIAARVRSAFAGS